MDAAWAPYNALDIVSYGRLRAQSAAYRLRRRRHWLRAACAAGRSIYCTSVERIGVGVAAGWGVKRCIVRSSHPLPADPQPDVSDRQSDAGLTESLASYNICCIYCPVPAPHRTAPPWPGLSAETSRRFVGSFVRALARPPPLSGHRSARPPTHPSLRHCSDDPPSRLCPPQPSVIYPLLY